MPRSLSERATPCGKCDLELSSTTQPKLLWPTQNQYAVHEMQRDYAPQFTLAPHPPPPQDAAPLEFLPLDLGKTKRTSNNPQPQSVALTDTMVFFFFFRKKHL